MRVGGRDIAGSGSIVTNPGDSQVEIEHGNLTFVLNFIKGEGDPTVAGHVDGQRLKLDLLNFTNALPTGWTSEVGLINGRRLHLAMIIVAVGEGEKVQRSIAYTFSLEAA
jgi:hypothetical protein